MRKINFKTIDIIFTQLRERVDSKTWRYILNPTDVQASAHTSCGPVLDVGFWLPPGAMSLLEQWSILLFMKQYVLNIQLQKLIAYDYSDDFVAFCQRVVPKHPVAVNLSDKVNMCYDMLGNAMIVFSGYRAEEFAEFAMSAQRMVKQEIESGRWDNIPSDEEKAAEQVARRCYEGLTESNVDETDPLRVYLAIGLYCYVSVIQVADFDGNSFMRMFVLAWFVYYSTILSLENGVPSCGTTVLS